jgi:anti-sigma factor RsiW
MVSCADVEERLDAFIDGELSPSESVDVARHAGGCSRCDATMRGMLDVREALIAASERGVDALDLAGVWPHVETAIARGQAQAAWRERSVARRAVPRGLVWGTIAAMAATGIIMLRPTTPPTQVAENVAPPPAPTRVVDRRLPNHVHIDRLEGKDVGVRRERKSGTTVIWVNQEVEREGW